MNGVLLANKNFDEGNAILTAAGVKLIRLPVFLSQSISTPLILNYLKAGYKVQLNVNWYSTANGPVLFISNLDLYKTKLEQLLIYYSPYKEQIAFIVCENEWDNADYHSGNAEAYLNQLDAFVALANQYGYKTAEAGITSTALHRWTYSKLTGDEAAWWRNNYFTGLDNDYDNFIIRINLFLNGFRSINYKYANAHWYNNFDCANGFAIAAQEYMEACNKSKIVCNEFGIKTNSIQLFTDTLHEIVPHVKHAIAYSGVNDPDKAITLTPEMLSLSK